MTALPSTEDLARLAKAITPGPWKAGRHPWPTQVGCCPLPGRPYEISHEMRNLAAANTIANAEAIALLPALIREVLDRREAEAWRDISTAPFDTPVAVKVGGMIFEAILQPDASIDEDNEFCSQWQAVNEGEHPPCWSDGACWGSNADGMISLQPTHWRPLPSTPTTEASHGA